jgi:hypothetical protein
MRVRIAITGGTVNHSIKCAWTFTAIVTFAAMPQIASAQMGQRGSMPAGETASGPVSLQAEMLKDWSDLKDTMVKIAAEMPADKFAFKPTPPQQTYAERIMHVASANIRFLGAMGGKAAAPTIDPKATDKDLVLKALADSFDYGTALLKEQSDQSMLQPIKAPFIGVSTRARLYTFLIGHTWDIYGQLAVYLRLSGGVPPASQRP